ncbi:MAG: peptide-methionine (S)-S-oxide reductase MsrA [Pararhizobium sp.]
MIRLALAVLSLALLAHPVRAAETGTAIFAGGCFWCVESDFDHVPGVVSTTSGYIGGSMQNPTYRNHPGFREAVKIEFDTTKTSYAKLLDVYWHSIDPIDTGGAFCDRGESYTTAIYTLNDKQMQEAKASKAEVHEALGKPIATVVKPAPKFWPAEDYHQDFYKKNPMHYQYYRSACGRDRQVKAIWGDKADEGIAAH